MQYPLVVGAAMLGLGCASRQLGMPANVDWHQYAIDRDGSGGVTSLRFRPDACEGHDLRPEYGTLNEASFVRFLQQQRYDVQVQRQQVDVKNPELHYVFVSVPGIFSPVPLRVAVLPNADEAGRALQEAVLQRGPGSWGVRRANVAVLGPIGSSTDDVAFAATTKLACWGAFMIAGTDDAFAVPGGYAEP
jgi:hypothetical protein